MSLPSEPITRKEQYLAKAAGQAVEIPAEPITREEAYLDAIAKGSGGGGGTSDYSQLTNKPQINGTTLTGNKSASDLSLATTADLAGKVDKVEGYGLSENDYTNEDKAIVGGVTAALAGKQAVLTAGNNIKIDNDTISVNRWAVPAGKVVYTIITSDENYGQNVHVQRHTLGGALIDDRTFLCEMYKTVDIDGLISIQNPYASFNITLLKDSDEQQAGYRYTVNPITTPTSNSFTFTMEQEENDNDLIIREELDAVSDAVDAIKDGANIDSFADVESALANKQDKTDNNLDTTSKTVVGAVNELKSGLTNVNADVKLNTNDLTTSSRTKNILHITLASIKALNTDGTWSGSSYTVNGVTFAVSTDSNGNISKINATGTASGVTYLILVNPFDTVSLAGCLINGLPSEGSSNSFNYRIASYASWSALQDINSNNTAITNNGATCRIAIRIQDTYEIATGGIDFYPMVRIATETDATYAPYIPSVESRIESVESGLIKITKESYENITVNAGSKKFVTNVGLLTDNVVITAYSTVSDVIAYVATGTTTYQVYLYNPTNAAITNNVTVMIAKV